MTDYKWLIESARITAVESKQDEGSDSGKVPEASQARRVSKLLTKVFGVALPAKRTLLN